MEHFGLKPADILLPKGKFEKFSVIACDQYTSEPEYWEKVNEITKDEVSARHIILPEIYLNRDVDGQIESINRTMQKYIDNEEFTEHKNAVIYVERTQSDNKIRHGLVGLVDLEDYDYSKGSKKLIRATEQTVLERIPPRVKIRKDAPLELPHIMLLIDDPDNTVIKPVTEQKERFEKAYDFDLMMNAGHIVGYFTDESAQSAISDALSALVEKSDDKFLFAVGDGNHSLATAKECYKQNPTEKSRYALVEVVNIHDDALQFEPIYRVLFNVDYKDVLDYLKANAPVGDNNQDFVCVHDGIDEELTLGALSKLPVGTLQKLLDDYVAKNDGVSIDYIHGISSVREICKQKATLGFIFDGMKKDELFPAIKQDGSLPRKTFSMGHADDKRFYVEARKIK